MAERPPVRSTESPVAQVVVRTADPETISRLELPAACHIRRTGDEVAIWLGPDEWLLSRPGVTGPDHLGEIVARAGEPDASYFLDATGQRTRLLLTGCRAETVLAHGCAIDLASKAFGPDETAQTLIAQTGVILHRVDDGFALFVRSSFTGHLTRWLVDASTEYCTGPAAAATDNPEGRVP
ncbi:sarcosine oxidase subunit gamma [Gordonia sp. DT30]|uniref:sarcosine oxidase subunit gamma n=1 Tax=Gordonia sp. DT30 TaxID=3416546 RepID=UPI003CEC2F19